MCRLLKLVVALGWAGSEGRLRTPGEPGWRYRQWVSCWAGSVSRRVSDPATTGCVAAVSARQLAPSSVRGCPGQSWRGEEDSDTGAAQSADISDQCRSCRPVDEQTVSHKTQFISDSHKTQCECLTFYPLVWVFVYFRDMNTSQRLTNVCKTRRKKEKKTRALSTENSAPKLALLSSRY